MTPNTLGPTTERRNRASSDVIHHATALGVALGILLFASQLRAQQRAEQFLPVTTPEQLGMRGESFSEIEPLVKEAITAGNMPGCVVLIGHRGHVVYEQAFGDRQVEPTRIPMTIDTVFDLASLTKPIATATSVMQLVERGKIRLRDRAESYLPEFGQNGKDSITVTQLLTHQAGLIPDNALADYQEGRRQAIENIFQLPTVNEPGTRFSYTDVGFIVLGEMVAQVSGKELATYVEEELFGPLRMDDTRYLPSPEMKQRAAPTERRNGEWIVGEVHDPRADAMDGVAGHAGLFSTANDLAIYAQMMLNGGSYRGTRILSPPTIEVMTSAFDVSRGSRGLGWDKQSPYSSNRGELMTDSAFGHGGFTGTAIWIDPGLDLFVIFLSSRLHPDGEGSVNRLAGRIGTLAAASVVERPAQPDDLAEFASAAVLNGIDVLVEQGFEGLQGERVGLITNQTGRTRDGKLTALAMAEAENFQLAALFSPEHGFEGMLDQSSIADSVDEQTGLPIYSLYGATRRPTGEMLAGLDVLVFDIQDIGTRFYTYVSTMGEAMQVADEQGIRFVVLDRPNPINGIDVDGPVLDEGKQSFVGFHTIPVRHGMTAGELALMFRHELELELELEVVTCRGWRRANWFDETGLLWINPSPNMRNLNQAFLYPGIGLLETTNLSVGRGTDTPFELIGAPWIEARRLAQTLNQQQLDGIRFVPVEFVPESSKFAGQRCQGVQLLITDRDQLRPIQTGLTIAITLHRLFPEAWEIDHYHRLLGSQSVLDAIKQGSTFSALAEIIQPQLVEFRKRREPFLLYE